MGCITHMPSIAGPAVRPADPDRPDRPTVSAPFAHHSPPSAAPTVKLGEWKGSSNICLDVLGSVVIDTTEVCEVCLIVLMPTA